MTIFRRRDGSIATEDEAFEDDVLRDGYSISVPVMMRDGMSKELDDAATVTALFHDGYGRPAGHRPGYCIPTDPDMVRRRALVRDAYAEVAERDANAWRNPRPWAGAAALPAEAPDHLMADALQMLDEKERAYREAAWADENAWRNVR